MTQTENTTESHKGKHLTYEERLKIEAWKHLDNPLSNREIARRLGRAPQTIHTEINDGRVRQIRRQLQNGKNYEYEFFCYFASAGQAAYDNARKNSRKQPKWVNAPEFMAYADHQMKKENQSPDVVVGRAKKLGVFKHEDIPCTTTLYNYIDLCLMDTRNIDLHLKTRRNTKSSRNRKNKTILGELIEKRPDIVDTRERFWDWEIDTVNGLQGKGDQALLTLTERKTRYEVIIKIDGKASNPVNHALATMKAAAGNDFELLFKTITSDNGIIRRFIPKGSRIADVSLSTIRRVQDWMNNLPRRILGYATPRECLLEEMKKLTLSV